VLKEGYDYKSCLLNRVEHLHAQIHIVSNATQKLGLTRTCIAKHYLRFTEYTIQYIRKKKTKNCISNFDS
jgi:hypothetical protein